MAAALGALGVLALLVVADPFVRTGWTASWFVEHEGVRQEMARTTEHRLSFPNEQRPLARYAQRWDFARFGIPAEIPRLDVTLRARLFVPEGGRYLHLDASDRTTIRVDGRELRADEAVGEGWHALEVDWRGTLRASTRLALNWGSTMGDLEPVPRASLVPGEGSWPPTRIWLWIVAVCAAGALAAALYRIESADTHAARARRIASLMTALVVILGVGIRLIDYDVMPDFRENDDERFAIWDGYQILEDGTTQGLTLWHGDYAATGHGTIFRARFFDRDYHMVTPYFEHPPLLHLLVGATGHLGGAQEYREVRLSHARLVPILLSAITLLLIIAIGRRLSPTGPAPWLGALLYAAIPWIAIQTRVVKEEALVVPLASAATLFFLRWRDDGKKTRELVLAAVMAGLCPLAKVTGLAIIVALCALVARETLRAGARQRPFWIAVGTSLGTASLLLVWGAVVNWSSFIYAQGLQTSRPVHFNIFLRFFDDALINHNIVGRGWLLFLWLAAMGGMYRRKPADTAALALPLMCYFAMIALGSGTWTFGWYVLPLLPFLCIAAGIFLGELWARPDLLRGGLMVFTLVFYSLNFVVDPEWAKQGPNWPELRRWVTAALVVLVAPFGIASAFRGGFARAVGRAGIVLGLATTVVLGVYFVAHYDVITSQYHDFDRDRYFDR